MAGVAQHSQRCTHAPAVFGSRRCLLPFAAHLIVAGLTARLVSAKQPSFEELESRANELGAAGTPDGWADIGMRYLTGADGWTRDGKKGLELITKAADLGDAESQYNLGLLYMDGELVPKDVKKAAQLWKKAADLGHAMVQFNLGLMYHSGDGVEKSYKQALKYWKMASKQGDVRASENIAVMYEEGQGSRVNTTKAAQFWNIALGQGSEKAKGRLAFYNFQGEGGVDANKTRAAELLATAAEQGDGTAQFNLAIMFLEGDGIPKNETRAEELLKDSMETRNWNAAIALGKLWEDGRGAIKKNETLARAVYKVVIEKAPDTEPLKKEAQKLYDAAIRKAGKEMMGIDLGEF